MNIEIIEGDITEQEVDAIVNAANNHLWMGSGVAGAIKRKGGAIIEKEAMRQGPIPVGQAVATTAGMLKARFVIHAAGMGQDLATSASLVRQATESALQIGKRLKIKSLAFPAIGTGVGGLGLVECARAMLGAVRAHQAISLEKAIFVLFDPAAKRAFEQVLEQEL